MRSTVSSRTLFVVRGKLGDSLAAWPTIRAYQARHPEEEVAVALRRNYSFLFAAEPGIKLIPFASTAELLLRVFWLRLCGGIDRLAVLWGFGKPISRLVRWSNAPIRAYLDNRFGTQFNHIAPPTPNEFISDAAWRVATCLDPALPRPMALEIPGLAQKRQHGAPIAVGLVPIADEVRRVFDHTTFIQLVTAARRRFPNAPLWLLGNPKDAALKLLLKAGLPSGVELKPFPELHQLVDALSQCQYLLTTDTGVYHLAASIGVPCTVFFGPTQPDKTVMPAQQDIEKQRLPSLGNDHCEVKECKQPHCLSLAVDHWCGGKNAVPETALLPDHCLLIRENQTP